MQPMSYKPSRTREERKNAPLYVPESELRQQLEQQANLKRRQKTLESLKEKQEILDHYANFKLPGGESDTELASFLAQKQQELDVLNRQLESQAPELYMENKEPGSREIKRKDVQAPVFNDNFFSKQDTDQGRILSKGEIEREKRLKLRDEERMRRLAGVKESAYDGTTGNTKSYLPQSLPSLPGVSQPVEPKEELVLPIHRKQMNMAAYEPDTLYGERRGVFQPMTDNRSSIEMHGNMLPALDKKEAERAAMKDMLFGNKEDQFIPKKEFASRIEDKENTPTMNVMPVEELVRQASINAENKLPPIYSEYNKGENVAVNKERESQSRGGNREKVEKTMGGNDIFSKLGGGQGQGNLSEAEKKRKYKEELDAMMKMKKENAVPEGRRNSERRPSYGSIEAAPRDVRSEVNIDSREAPRSLPSIQAEKGRVEREAYAYPMGDRNMTDKEEKKKKYAEELMQEIAAKEKEKERAKQERRAPSSGVQNRMPVNEGAWSELNAQNAQNRVSESQDRSYDRGARRDELPPRAGGHQVKDENSEMEKKRKYKEFLDAQVEERKRRDKADADARGGQQENRQEVYQQGRGERIERMESREERPSREIERPSERFEGKGAALNNEAAGGFFLHKGEDEEKQRAQVRNQQKQKMAEELKKQMEEKEEQKRKEKQKKAEEDLREKQRLERDAEQEKRRKEEENQKKQQAEKKTQEYNVHPSAPETHAHHEAKPQYTHVPDDDLERPGPDMGGRQAHLERAAPYNEPAREDQYHSRGNEQYGGHNRGGYEQNMYPPQHGHHGYYPHEGMMPPQQYGEGYGYPGYHHQMQYPRQSPMGFEGHQQYGGYGMGGNLLQEMANYNMLMQQLMEEKLKIDKIALEEQLVLEQYNNKIKEMKVEKIHYDKEIDKIKKMLHGELPVNASVMGGMDHHMDRSHQLDVKMNALNDSYLPALTNLRNAKANHMNYYNRLLAQSQNNFSGQLRGLPNPNMGLEDTMKSQALDDSAILRQSLPCSSDLRPISRANLENSFQKDLKAYQEARGQQQQQQDNNYNIESFSNRMLSENVLQPQPQQPEQPLKKKGTLEHMLDFSTSQPNVSHIKAPVTGHEKGMMNEEFGESMILPEIEGTRAKRKIEQTPQVIYDRTPARLSQEEAPATHHEIFDLRPGNVSDLKMVEDISQFKLNTPKESNRHTQELPVGRGHQGDMFKRESQVAKSYAQEPEEMSLKKRLQAVSNEENLQDTLQASLPMEKLKNEGEMEVKMQEGNAERSLILAEEEEDYNRDDYDAFVESQDQVLEELGIGYAKKGQRKVSRSPKKEIAPAIVEKMSKDKPKSGEISHAVEGHSGSHEKKYGKPKTRDPFAKAMESELSKSKGVLTERKEEQPSEFSKWNEFVMESEKKERPTEKNISSMAPREDFEPIKVDESVFPEKNFEKHDETNEVYIDEDIQGSVEKKKKHYGEQFEVEEKLEENNSAENLKYYDKENVTANVQGKPRKARELERLGSKKDVNTGGDSNQMKLQSNISLEEEDSKNFIKPITKTRNTNMDLLLGRNSESLASKREAMKAMKAMKNENKVENERRSKNILDRLQRLLDNWGDEMNEENNENEKDLQNKGSEIEESSELGKVNQSRDLFKPLGIARSYSNRYSQEGDH